LTDIVWQAFNLPNSQMAKIAAGCSVKSYERQEPWGTRCSFVFFSSTFVLFLYYFCGTSCGGCVQIEADA